MTVESESDLHMKLEPGRFLPSLFHNARNMKNIRAVTCDFQQCGILTSEYSDEPM